MIAGADLEQAKQKAQALLSEIRCGRALLRAGQRILTDRRFQLGELLAGVRKRFPASGKGAAGWGRFCRELGLKRGTAVRYIEIAEQVAAQPELAERRTFLDIYQELGFNVAPPQSRFAPVTAANVRALPTPAPLVADDTEPDDEEEEEDTIDSVEEDGEEQEEEGEEPENGTADAQRGRPPLSPRERRDDIYMVRLNTEETVRLRRLSGLLAIRDAEVFREGLLALEEREAEKAAPLHRAAPAALRRAR